MTNIILSLHPEWWAKMLSGEKTAEIRKTAPRRKGPYRAYVYLTGTGQIWGYIDIDRIEKSTPEEIAAEGGSCVPLYRLREYAAGKPLYAWKIARVVELKAPIRYSKRPPQSWVYAPTMQEN